MEKFLSVPAMIIILAILAALSFFFSTSETSIIGLSKIRLRHMLSRGIKRAQSVQRIIAKLDKFIVAILVFNNVVSIAMSAIVTAFCILVFGYRIGIIVATIGTTFFVLIICEITPEILAIKHTERVALFVSPLMEVFLKVFSPVISFFSWASNMLIKMLGIKASKRSPLITEEELRLMIELGKEEGFLSDDKGRMLQRIFQFGETKVSDVMQTREQMVAVDINTSPEQLLNIFVENGHARLPVYKGHLTNIVGIIYARDLLYILRDKGLFVLQDLVQEPYFVLGSMQVNELLKKFQADKIQIAIVVDEHKKAQGLVTLEDLTEEIVGETGDRPIRLRKKAS